MGNFSLNSNKHKTNDINSLYLPEFYYHRKFFYYTLLFHLYSNSVCFLKNKYLSDPSNLNYHKYLYGIVITYIISIFISDLEYIVFRKNVEEKFVKSFKDYTYNYTMKEKLKLFFYSTNYFKIYKNFFGSNSAFPEYEESNFINIGKKNPDILSDLLTYLEALENKYVFLRNNLSFNDPQYLNKIKTIEEIKKCKKSVETKILKLKKDEFLQLDKN
jgi:hypothetical protein